MILSDQILDCQKYFDDEKLVNQNLNNFNNTTFIVADVFEYLDNCIEENKKRKAQNSGRENEQLSRNNSKRSLNTRIRI